MLEKEMVVQEKRVTIMLLYSTIKMTLIVVLKYLPNQHIAFSCHGALIQVHDGDGDGDIIIVFCDS